MNGLIKKVAVDYSTCVTSDHIPLSIVLDIQQEHVDMFGDNGKPEPMYKVKWDSFSREDKDCYMRP